MSTWLQVKIPNDRQFHAHKDIRTFWKASNLVACLCFSDEARGSSLKSGMVRICSFLACLSTSFQDGNTKPHGRVGTIREDREIKGREALSTR